jgi:hypothetical protein
LPPVGELRESERVVIDTIAWHISDFGCDGKDLYWGHCADDCAMVLYCLPCSVPLCILGSGPMAGACDVARSAIDWMTENGGSFYRGPDYEG